METSENIQYIERCTIQMENYTKITKKIHVQYKLKKKYTVQIQYTWMSKYCNV